MNEFKTSEGRLTTIVVLWALLVLSYLIFTDKFFNYSDLVVTLMSIVGGVVGFYNISRGLAKNGQGKSTIAAGGNVKVDATEHPVG